MFCNKKCTAKFGIFVIILLAVNCILFYEIYYELPKILHDFANAAVEETSDESFRGSSEIPESETQSSTETIYSTESVNEQEDYGDYSVSSEPPISTKRPSLSDFEAG